MKIIRKDGSPLDVILDVTALYDENGIIKESRSVWRDVSEMKKAQRRIIDIQAKLQTIINNLPLILWSTDTNGIYNLSDGQGLQKIGFEPGQLVGQSLFDVYSDNPAIIEANRRALDGETFETTNQIGETSYESYYAPQVDAEDNIIGVIGLAFDVTDRLQTEKALEESKQQLVQSQKMEAIGRLAGGIAHDFNNQLTGILGYSSFLLTKLSDEDELRSAVKEIEEAGEKSASLVKQLLTFSRKQNIAPKVINLNDILKNTLKMLKRVIGEDIKLETKLDPNLGNINADPTQINQIIMNLAVNSREAMIDGGRLTISTENLIKTDFPTGDKSQKPVVALIISDTGIGMSEETISRIFEPFFTTKEHGTGLGLATVYGIIKQNLGEIEVESQLGKGTTFTVFLPQTLEKVCTKIDDVTHISKQRATADILIVEDEDSLRRLAKLILEDQGYQVVDTDHPRKALSIVELKNFDLIISDVIMPGMNGLELIRKIKKKVQKLRVLFITGYIEQPLFKEIIKENYTILEKPFSRTTFLKRVEELLEE
jgi:signal transduction histidine kinase